MCGYLYTEVNGQEVNGQSEGRPLDWAISPHTGSESCRRELEEERQEVGERDPQCRKESLLAMGY